MVYDTCANFICNEAKWRFTFYMSLMPMTRWLITELERGKEKKEETAYYNQSACPDKPDANLPRMLTMEIMRHGCACDNGTKHFFV